MALLIFNIVMMVLMITVLVAVLRDALSKRPNPPFIRTRRRVVDEVVEAFGDIPAGSVVYDIGAGDGRILRALAARNPGARHVAIELRRIPFLLGFLKTKVLRHSLQHVQGNLFDQNLKEATHIYAYLYPWVMDELLPKLEREAKPGLRLITLDFPFTNKPASAKLPLRAATPRRLGRMLYVYEF